MQRRSHGNGGCRRRDVPIKTQPCFIHDSHGVVLLAVALAVGSAAAVLRRAAVVVATLVVSRDAVERDSSGGLLDRVPAEGVDVRALAVRHVEIVLLSADGSLRRFQRVVGARAQHCAAAGVGAAALAGSLHRIHVAFATTLCTGRGRR